MQILKRYTVISAGCLLFAAGFALFWAPAELAPGGVSGAAVLVTHFFPALDSGWVILLLNLPLLIAGVIYLGGGFFFGTVWATLLSSGMITAMEESLPRSMPDDRWFCAVSGALLCGLGIGMVYRCGATTGGTDIAVRLLARRFPDTRPGFLFLAVDSAVVLASGLVFRDVQTSLYSGVALLFSMAVFHAVQEPPVRSAPSRSSK